MADYTRVASLQRNTRAGTDRSAAASPQKHFRWPLLFWCAGSLIVLFRFAVAETIALAIRIRSLRPDEVGLIERADRIAALLGVKRRVALLQSRGVIAPFTFGTWRPAIVLPYNFALAFTPAQQDAALAHELAHVAGFDSAWRRVSELACALLVESRGVACEA